MGRDKAALPFGTESLLARTVRLVREVADNVVVCGRGQVAAGGARALEDAHPGAGPLVALLDAAERLDAGLLIVVACDMPLLRPAVLRRLLDGVGNGDACVPKLGGIAVPTCAVYRRSAVVAAGLQLRAEGASSLRALLGRLDVRFVDEASLREVDPLLLSFTPCNTPEQYRRALGAAGFDAEPCGTRHDHAEP